MKYKPDDIEKLKSQVNIVDVVGEYVDLKKSGANYKGLCPFHKDTNPSFVVNEEKQICKCFVCGAGGSLLKFYSDYNKLSFVESVEELSKKYSIDIKPLYENAHIKNLDTNYKKIMNEALNYFKENIFKNDGREALEYLSKRGFMPDFIVENSIGYATKSWTGLYEHLISKEYTTEDIVTMGLVKEGEKGRYDTFRDRVIFPIYSPTGDVIAFGGRTLSDKKEIAKYLNSPETPLFNKGSNLYGIKQRGQVLRKKQYAIIMEGYMDVLTAHLHGFDVALAPLGTAFTREQSKLLKRYTENVILAFDMDGPGQSATEKTAMLLKEEGFKIRVLKLEGAKDPDEFLSRYGREKFLEAVKESLEIFDFLFELYVQKYGLDSVLAKNNLIEEFKGFFQIIETNVEKNFYIDQLATNLDLDKTDLKRDLIVANKEDKGKYKPSYKEYKREKGEKSKEYIVDVELQTLRLIIHNKENIRYFLNVPVENELLLKILFYGREIEEKELLKSIMRDEGVNFTKEEREQVMEYYIANENFVEESSGAKEGVRESEYLRDTLKGWLKKIIKLKIQEINRDRSLNSLKKITKINSINKIIALIQKEKDNEKLFETFEKIEAVYGEEDIFTQKENNI